MKLVATLVTLVAAFSLPLASQAQPAAWPDGMQHLRHAPSESRVPALLPPFTVASFGAIVGSSATSAPHSEA